MRPSRLFVAVLSAVLVWSVAVHSASPQQLSPQAEDPSLEKALSLWQSGEYQKANAEFRNLVNRAPTNPDFKVQWGRLFLDVHNDRDSAALFREALAIKSDHAGALLGLALVATERGLRTERESGNASELVERALRADASLTEGYELRARLAVQDRDFAKAAIEADRALSIAPNAL